MKLIAFLVICVSLSAGVLAAATAYSPSLDREDLIPKAESGEAQTYYEVRQRMRGFVHLECQPKTGRTHQIRVHLASIDLPIVGDPLYQRDGLGDRQTLQVSDAPLCLHAWQIELHHPADERTIAFEAPPPAWAEVG